MKKSKIEVFIRDEQQALKAKIEEAIRTFQINTGIAVKGVTLAPRYLVDAPAGFELDKESATVTNLFIGL